MSEPAKRLISPTGKPIQLLPTRANEGVRVAYQRRLHGLIDVMHADLLATLKAEYLRLGAAMAQDASPQQTRQKLLRKLTKRWTRSFEQVADENAREFIQQAAQAADGSLAGALRAKGFSVKFQPTREMQDAVQESIGENVALIRSIGKQHLGEVEKLVAKSVESGRDLGQLTKDLTDRYQITKRRAAFIARDQNNKATAIMTRVRQQGLGITEAIWQHSSAGKKPRPSHVAANGKRYDVNKGMFIDGEWIRPGELPNCRCVSISIIPGLDDD